MTFRPADTSCHGVRLLGGNGSIPLDRENPVLNLRSAKSFVVGIIDRQTLQSFTNGGVTTPQPYDSPRTSFRAKSGVGRDATGGRVRITISLPERCGGKMPTKA